jgi:hypothetical protein
LTADAINSFLDVQHNEAVGQFDLFADLFGEDPEAHASLAVTPRSHEVSGASRTSRARPGHRPR